MRIRSQKDFASGLMFILVDLGQPMRMLNVPPDGELPETARMAALEADR